ncbi:DUF4838 domain-containing protein [Verrucomicrobiota bacterium]
MKEIIRGMAAAVLTVGIVGFSSCNVTGPVSGPDLSLAVDGKTDYAIVRPSVPTDVDGYAINVLTNFLFQKTGACFPVVNPDQISPTNKYIFVGLSAPVLKRVGKNPLALLKDQGHVARSAGVDIVLYGKGIHGNLYAVFDFMENTLGWRWFSRFDKPVFTVERDLTLKPFNRTKGVSFAYRRSFYYATEFCYQHGMNVGFSSISALIKARHGKDRFPPGVVSAVPQQQDFIGVHSLHQYIPPTPTSHLWEPYQWIEKRNYFETNPEFFTMNSQGKRVPNRQLCFSNPGLRKELTKNILEHARRQGADAPIALGAEDSAQPFCECPECRQLEKKYSSPGGPFYDYLLELAPILQREHPTAMIKVLSYRRIQTQKPPVLPPGAKLPDNVYVVFAHIDDGINVDWNHPDNRSTYEDLFAWGKLTKNLWTWSYPLPSGKGVYLPFSNTRRLVQTMRAMKQAGVEGVYQEYYADRVLFGYGFSELHVYLYYKLAREVDADVPALIREFTDYQYGAAAEKARNYLDQLETAVAAIPPITQCPVSYEDFPYLTAENIHRWQTMFDQMEAVVAGNSRCLANLRRLRREVDFATLLKWFDLVKAYPDYFNDHTVYTERFTATGKAGAAALVDLVTVIKGGGKIKPLPPEFDGVPTERIRQFVPENKGQGSKASKQKTILDPDAAFGYAATVYRFYDRDIPFAFGFFQDRIGATEAPWGTAGAQRELKLEDITPGVYRVYKLGTIEVTPSCRIWLQVNQGWATVLDLGERLHNNTDPSGAANRWEAYVSLKFDGPAYGGKAVKGLRNGVENLVLCDRVILVKQQADTGKIK